jgi:HAD superfamily hydrolase (TIGR01509 family)
VTLRYLRPLDIEAVTVVLCDADGNLFPSEEPAFDASVDVTNRYLAGLGVPRRYTAQELRIATTGKNFRTTAVDLAAEWGVPVDAAIANGRSGAVLARGGDSGPSLSAEVLEQWVRREQEQVTAHLGSVLRPDSRVREPLRRMAQTYGLAAVSSSALLRLAACFTATGLDDLIPADVRFSAEDSLPAPTSKPDPAVYLFALAALGIRAEQAVAIEDSVPGVASAVAAGVATIGNVMFVPPSERDRRRDELAVAGASAVVDDWHEIASLLGASIDESEHSAV